MLLGFRLLDQRSDTTGRVFWTIGSKPQDPPSMRALHSHQRLTRTLTRHDAIGQRRIGNRKLRLAGRMAKSIGQPGLAAQLWQFR